MTFHPDGRGEFGELWRHEWTSGLAARGVQADMRQANMSRSDARVLRGLHVHQHQADVWVIADGHPFVALVDTRPAIRGVGRPVVETIDAGPGETFYLPAGVAHGFYARDPLMLVYLVTNTYDGTDERASRGTTRTPGSRGQTLNRSCPGATRARHPCGSHRAPAGGGLRLPRGQGPLAGSADAPGVTSSSFR